MVFFLRYLFAHLLKIKVNGISSNCQRSIHKLKKTGDITLIQNTCFTLRKAVSDDSKSM